MRADEANGSEKATMRSRTRTQADPRVPDDDARPADVISLAARRAARYGSPMRDWAPAILATFFTPPRLEAPSSQATSAKGSRTRWCR
jgi:hypothetical protein